MTTQNDGLWAFFGLTFALMAATFGVMAVFQIPGPALDPSAEPSTLGIVLFLIGGFSPTIAGVIMAATQGDLRDLLRRSVRFGLGARWYAVIVGLPLLALLADLLVHIVTGGGIVAPFYLNPPAILISQIPVILLFGPISEELGWRGFAQDRLLKRYPVPLTNLIMAAFWALWHLPLFFVPGTSQQQLGNPALMFPAFSLQILALTVIYTWVYANTERSVWSAIFLHFTTAFIPFLINPLMADGGAFISPVILAVYIVAAVIITVRGKHPKVAQPAPALGR